MSEFIGEACENWVQPHPGQFLLSRALLLALILLAGGAVLLCIAYRSSDPLFVLFGLLALGAAVTGAVFSGAEERKAFLLTYGVCVLVAGLAHCYSLLQFGTPQSTTDAETFIQQIAPKPPFVVIEDINANFNSPLAVLIWQQAYAVTWWLGLGFGPYTGVLLNALVIGWTGAITVRTARQLLGDDSWRLGRLVVLFASCGWCWLFGAILIRDCFLMFLNAVFLAAVVCWLQRPNLRNLLWFVSAVAICGLCLASLRKHTLLLLAVFVCLAFLCWYWEAWSRNMRVLLLVILLLLLPLVYAYLETYIQVSLETLTDKADSYATAGEDSSSSGSLGLSLVVHQALPIRLVLGSGAMLVYPIPLWGYLAQSGVGEYHLLRTWQGFFQVAILPLVLAGFLMGIGGIVKDRASMMPHFFVAAYTLIGLLAVVATSLEGRHFGQFFPAALILAVLPDTREPATRRTVWRVAILWLAVVVAVHVAWSLLRQG